MKTKLYPYVFIAAFVLAMAVSQQVAAQQLELSSTGPSGNGPVPTSASPTTTQTANLFSNTGTSTTFNAYTPTITVSVNLSNEQYTSSNYPGVTIGANVDNLTKTSLKTDVLYNSFNYIGSPSNGMFTSAPDATTNGQNFDIANNYGFVMYTDAFYQGNNSLSVRSYYANLTVSFSRPVINPVLHFTGLGAASGVNGTNLLAYYTELELSNSDVTAGRTLTRLSGSTFFSLDGTNTKILNTNPNVNTTAATNYTSDQVYAGAGSVMVNTGSTPISSVTFRVYLKGNGGSGPGNSWMPAAGGRIGDGWMLSASLGLYTISGTVYDDANGLNGTPANTVDGTGTNTGGTLYANLVDANGNVYAVTTVASAGTYSFTAIPSNYTVILTTTAGTVGSPLSASSLPTNWISTGENFGATAGNDGTVDGKLSVTVINANVANVNFGIEKIPTANAVTAASQPNPGGTTTVTVPTLTGSDLEDQPTSGSLSGKTVIITTLPANGTLYYSGIAVTAGQTISSYNPALLTVDPNDNISTLTFTYQYVDNDLQASTAATVTMPFTNSISGNVYNDLNGLADNTVNGTGTNAGTTLYAILFDNTTGKVAAITTVANTGIYSFNAVTPGDDYKIEISTTNSAVGNTSLPTATLPAGWYNTGSQLGSGAASNSTPGILSLGTPSTNTSNANFGISQIGYMYLHKTTEDESFNTDFPFSVSGGSTTVSSFNLNDNSAAIPIRDIGASQNGRLWVISGSSATPAITLFYRDAGSSVWVQTSIANAQRVDGGSGSTCYYTDLNGNVISYNGTTGTTIGAPANYGSSNATYIGSTWDSRPYIITSAGKIWRYSGSGTTWAQIGASTNNFDVDGDPSTGNIIVSRSDGNIYSITPAGVETSLGKPAGANNSSSNPLALAADASGNIFGLFFGESDGEVYVYKWISGTTWSTAEVTSRSDYTNATGTNGGLTGSIGNQIWFGGFHGTSAPYGNILTRSVDGSGNIWWIDDERVRTSVTNGNSEMIAVIPGTYTVTETPPAGWDLTNITLRDPSSLSSFNIAANNASIAVTAGATVHAIFQNTKVTPFSMTTDCGNAYIDDFGTGTTGTYGAALTGQTTYHYTSTSSVKDGYYAVVSQSKDFRTTAVNYYDHTSNNGTGRMMIINASYTPEEFFRRRFTGLVIGATYSFSAWVLNVTQNTILPNVTFKVVDPTTYNTLASNNTGNIANGSGWQQFTLSFVATATSIDLILNNNTTGGSGNDLAIDDISFALSPPATPVTTITHTTCSSATGSITITSPAGSSYQYSKDGINWQSSATFSSLSPGIYTISARFIGTTCVTSSVNTVKASICGNVYNDLNALTDNTVNGTGTDAGSTLKAVLYDSTSMQVEDVANVAADGTFSLLDGYGDKFTVFLTTTATAVTIGQTAVPMAALPAGWVNTGEHLGATAGSDGVVNGILPIGIVTGNVTNGNFGIVQCSSLGLAITASANKTLVCASTPSTVTLTSTPSGGITPYASYLWTGSGVSPTNTQNTSAIPTASGTYSVTVTDALGCTATGTTALVTYDNTTPSISPNCSGGGASLQLIEINGVSWTWTTTSGGRFYTDASYSVNSDSDVSHLQAPFINKAGSYTVQMVDVNGCSSSATIPVTTSSCTVLASNMTGLLAQRTGNIVALQWQAANSASIKEFIVERSTDGSNFITAGKVPVTTNGNYHFDDDVSLLGCIKLYYRVQETGADNSRYTSNIIPVNCNANDASQYVFNVYPNPFVSGNKLTVNYSLPVGITKGQIILTNILGGQQYGYVLSNTGNGVNTATIPVNSNMAAGTYFIRIISDKWISKTIKIIKQ